MRHFHLVSSILDCGAHRGQGKYGDDHWSALDHLQPESRSGSRLPARRSQVSVGHGWLIFSLPPSEVDVHPPERNDVYEFYLMCTDVEALIKELGQQEIGRASGRGGG